ncbi:alcohol dehydrogenase [Angomonas deanei]|uniref:Iron-containing alcohol dehydrogenase, putative n=1 Tax=Angomonas deanei TaxID=59799 RepID=A0A7G2CGH6_9TRYP|nr:alcohol dehydrogenase [Angomonas deanei]CAD2218071.1 Iron-containing alcohol dehydrogenase, putative [Angomonas deanei]|eukprot:EPY32523.1 alcohol dehydrogenase [Angomonas deanei]
MDPVLIPQYAVLDPVLTVGLPKFITATTGVDTLTHAIESYINLKHVAQTKRDGLKTVSLVFKYLKRAYDNGNDLVARENMQEAAYLGGLAFTRAYVGNVHALAHVLGAYYDIPHGYANAIILPHVLEKYGTAIYPSLSDLAIAAGISGTSAADRAVKFIRAVKRLNADLNIPETLANDPKYQIQDEHIPAMVRHALREANPLYAVPVIFGEEEMTEILKKVQCK